MKIRRWSHFGLAVSLSAILLGSLAPVSLAGSSSVNNSGDSSSAGTNTFPPDSFQVTLTRQQATTVTNEVLGSLKITQGSDISEIESQLWSLTAAKGLSDKQIKQAAQSIKQLLAQAQGGNLQIRARRSNNFSITCQNIQTILQENGSTAETAELTASILNTLESCKNTALTRPVVEFTLAMQGLTDGTTFTSERLLYSIEAFNSMVNNLNQEQLEIAAKDVQIQAIKALLEGLSEAITAG